MKKIIFSIIIICFTGIIIVRNTGNPRKQFIPDHRYDRDLVSGLMHTEAVNPLTIARDPYKDASVKTDSTGPVCGLKFINKTSYTLKTFPSETGAFNSGYRITHFGPCGTCSTLRDLAVYLDHPDLTTPVRRCSALVLSKTKTLQCLKNLGFTDSCALTWYYNALNTARACAGSCIYSWIINEPNNNRDGSLNRCLSCDEEKSGPVFKAVAGRTRRSSGLRSAIERREGEIHGVDHRYF